MHCYASGKIARGAECGIRADRQIPLRDGRMDHVSRAMDNLATESAQLS